MRKLKIGIVGTGLVADCHYKAFKQNRNAEIIGMCHTYNLTDSKYRVKQKSLMQKCNEFKIKAYHDFDELLSDPEIDAIIICSINSFHFKQIIAAINNGKHVLAENPVVTDVKLLREIERLSKKKGVSIFPAHNFVYTKAIRKAKELIENGEIGQIIHASFISSKTISENHILEQSANQEEYPAMFDKVHHLIYQSLYLLGFPARIHSSKSRIISKNMDYEANTQLSMQFANGSMALIMQSCTTDYLKRINGIRILGSKGSIVLTDALYFNEKKIIKSNEYLDSFVQLSKAFTDNIMKGIPPISDLNTVRETLEITTNAYQITRTELLRIL